MVVPDSLTLSCRLNRSSVPQGVETEVVLLTSLQTIEEREEEKRNPVDIVVVLDRSFSMAKSDKLELCKKTLAFLCKEILNENDRLGLVAFDSEANVVYPPNIMTPNNKQTFLQKLNALKVGDHTNLSAGLFLGFDLLKTSFDPSLSRTKGVTAILLLSDGEMTSGIMDRAKLVRMTHNVRSDFPVDYKPTVHCFGYGETYDPVLKTLAEATGGTFYDVANLEHIPLAFADTLGGLLHVAAQNVCIQVEVSGGGAEIISDSPLTKCGAGGRVERLSGCACKLILSDIYLGERKDILLKLRLPKVESAFAHVQCKVQVKFVDVIKERSSALETTVFVNRVDQALPSIIEESQHEDNEVKRQMIRVETANALDCAKRDADQGNFGRSRTTIQSTLQQATNALKEMRIHEEEDGMISEIMSDLRSADQVLSGTTSREQFQSCEASKAMESASWSHSNQRSNNMSKKVASALNTLKMPNAAGQDQSVGATAAAPQQSSYDVSSKVKLMSRVASRFTSQQPPPPDMV